MNTINITMRDSSNKEVNREIDISNFMVSNGETSYITTNPDIQHNLLMDWIEERANEQHNTELTLVSWYTI